MPTYPPVTQKQVIQSQQLCKTMTLNLIPLCQLPNIVNLGLLTIYKKVPPHKMIGQLNQR